MTIFPDTNITDTAYPTGFSKIAPEYRDLWWDIRGCGENLDAPDFIVAGSTVYGQISCEPLSTLAIR